MAQGTWNDNYRTVYQDCSYDGNVLAADTATVHCIAAKTNYTVYVQAIIVNVSTSAAQSLVFQDTTGTPVVIHHTQTSPALGPVNESVDFGPEGKALTVSQGLDMTISGAGLAAAVKVIAYRKLTVVAAA